MQLHQLHIATTVYGFLSGKPNLFVQSFAFIPKQIVFAEYTVPRNNHVVLSSETCILMVFHNPLEVDVEAELQCQLNDGMSQKYPRTRLRTRVHLHMLRARTHIHITAFAAHMPHIA